MSRDIRVGPDDILVSSMGQTGMISTLIEGWRLPPGKPRIAVVQCRPPLVAFHENRRARLSDDIDEYVASLYAALDLAVKEETTVCIFPEYSWPSTEAKGLACCVSERLPEGSVVIAPFEHLSLSEYETVLQQTGVEETVARAELDDATALVEFRDRAIVNACIVFIRVGGKIVAYPQRKLRPAQLEEESNSGRWLFANSRSVRIFRGEGVAFAVLICFDFIARDPQQDAYTLEMLGDEALTWVFVPECNPQPLHATYAESLNSLFRHLQPPQAVVFANVAENTPLPIPNPQLGFSGVVGRIGDATFDDARAVLIDGFVQNKEARALADLRKKPPSIPHPEVATLLIRSEPTLAVFELPRIGASIKNVREGRASTTVRLHRFLGPEHGWHRIYDLAPFTDQPMQTGIPPGYIDLGWDLVGVGEPQKQLVALVENTNKVPVWVTGEGGLGKTALVAHTLQKNFPTPTVIWIDLGDLEDNEAALREKLLIAFGATSALVKTPAEQLVVLREHMKVKPTIVVLDSYDRWHANAFPDWLPSLLSGWLPRMIVTSRERPEARGGDAVARMPGDPQLGVRKLSLDEAHALIGAVARQSVTREIVEIVTNVTDRSALACVWLGELLRHAPAEAQLLIKRLEKAQPGIQTVYDAMLEGVSAEARMLIGVVCQLPAPVAESDLRRIIGCKSWKLQEAIRELESRSLIMKREGGWQPRHPFVKLYWHRPPDDPRESATRVQERVDIRTRLERWAADLLETHGGDLNFKGYEILERRWTNLGYLLRQLQSSDDAEFFLHLWDLADTFLWTKSRLRERLALGRAAEKISRTLGNRRMLGKALYESIAEVLWHLHGPSEEVVGHLDEAAKLFDDAGDLVHRARVEWYRSRIFAERGDYDAALASARAAVQIAEQSGDARTIGLAHHGLGNVHRRMHDSSKALEEYRAGEKYFAEARDPEMLAVAKRRLGCVRMREGELGQALIDLEASIDQLRNLGLHGEAAESGISHAQVLAKLGEVRDALRERDIAANLLEPLGSMVRNDEIAETTRLIEDERRRQTS